MGQSIPPVLTVRSNSSQRSFTTAHDVVVGSDPHANIHIAHQLIAPTHLLLRFDRGRWIAIDNGSATGMFVNGRRLPSIEIHHGQSINLGGVDGPRLTFDIGYHRGQVGGPPTVSGAQHLWESPTRAVPISPRPTAPPPTPSAAPQESTQMAPVATAGAAPVHADVANLQTSMMQASRPTPPHRAQAAGRVMIGRAADNDIVIADVLASRYHAYLTLTSIGTEIRDAHSSNGTFVNGVRVTSAVLGEGNIVTIGNTDLVFTDGVLLPSSPATRQTGGLEVREVAFHADGKTLLNNISLTARPGTLTAIIGGSGAGKTTLARLIAGYTQPNSGSVTFEGHNIHTEYASLRSRIGMVPQDDIVHRPLTVNQALGYAAELRLPPDTSKTDRAQVVTQVIEELGLSKHAETRVEKLSGGQRKRASVALELLTGPSLLILDEPTSGLDPALDLQVMTMLRQLADAGRVVLVVTHSLTYLEVCDQVLLLAPGGKTAFRGAPDQIGAAMGTTNWAHIFAKVGADPDEANRRFLAAQRPPPPAHSQKPTELDAPAQTNKRRQFSTIARRQIRLVIADRAYFAFLAVLPFVMGVLSLTVPGTTGFGIGDPRSDTPDEAGQILTLLTIAAVFMGTALTIRDLIGERAIFRREQAVGLSAEAYLLAKISVFGAFAIIQSAVTTGIVLLGKGTPTRPALLLGNASLELFLVVAATCTASAMLGLLLSALARSNEQIMPLLVVSLMMQLVLCGGLVPVTNRIFLDQLSWTVPARWGYAAQAATIDLKSLMPGHLQSTDRHWRHLSGTWLFDMTMLAVLSLSYVSMVWSRIRLKRH